MARPVLLGTLLLAMGGAVGGCEAPDAPPLASGWTRHVATVRDLRYTFDLPATYRMADSPGGGKYGFRRETGGQLQVLLFRRKHAGDGIEDAISPKPLPSAYGRRLLLERLRVDGKRGTYRVTAPPTAHPDWWHDASVALTDGDALALVLFTAPDADSRPSRNELLTIARSICPTPEN